MCYMKNLSDLQLFCSEWFMIFPMKVSLTVNKLPSSPFWSSGCSSLLNPFSCCSAVPLCNTTGGCAMGQYWCHLLEACVSVTSPCSPYERSSTAGDRSFPLPPRYPAISPFYHLVADLPLRVDPSSEPKHISVSLLFMYNSQGQICICYRLLELFVLLLLSWKK